MLSGLLLCACFCVWVVLKVRARMKDASSIALPPAYSGGLPVIGITHLLVSDTARLWNTTKSLCEEAIKQGGVISSKIGTDTYYLITDPEDGLTVANTCFVKHFIFKFAKCWIGEGLITGTPIWRRHRKLLNPAFSLPVIHGFLQVFNTQTKQMVREINQFAGKGLFDPSTYIKNTVLRISCMTVFGASGLHDVEFMAKYIQAVEEILFMLTQRFQKFWLQSEWIYRLCGQKTRQNTLVKTLNQMSDEIIQKKKAAMDSNSNNTDCYADDVTETYKPLLQSLLQISDALTDKEIREELDTTVAAGFETTSHLLEVLLILLGSYPEVQERVYQELMEVLGPERDVEKEDLQKLVYTGAVIKETLRFVPTVPVVLRYVDQDVKLKHYTMAAGSQCLIFTYGIHRSSIWGTDADQFRPERWFEPDIKDRSFAFAGFSFGKRSCIGKTYAMTSLKVALAHMVREFKFQADFSKVQFKLNVTLSPDKGREISVERRTHRP